MFIRIIIILQFLLSASIASCVEPQKIIIRVGESRPIQLVNALRVHVTRKGIILLTHDHDDVWTLTAIRTGVVAVETKLIGDEPRTMFVDVRPRQNPVKPKKLRASDEALMPIPECEQSDDGSQFEMHAIIELIDDSQGAASGVDSDVKLKFPSGSSFAEVNLLAEPRRLAANRHIIGDPVLMTRACEELVIRTGGEDQIESRSEDGHSVSTWKSHGLDIRMNIIPVDSEKIRIPFSVSLRTPSKGRGSYASNEITSSIEVKIGDRILAAILNLSSSSSSKKETLWLSSLPIIGPFFRLTDESKSTSKLLLWFEIHQRSAVSPTP